MEQLSGLDARFLYMESSTNYGHVGGVQIFATPATPHWRTPEEEAAHTEYLYSLATYTRRRLVEVPFGLDHPYWIEDPAFDREFHERFIAVPAPGTDRQLEQVVSRIAARPLDRSRPLWEVYLIEGVDEGRKFAALLQDPPLRDRRGVGHAAGPGDDAADPRTRQPPDAGEAVAAGAGPVASRDAGPRLGGHRPTPGEADRRAAPRHPPDRQRAAPGSGGPPVRERVPALLNQLRTQAPRTVFNQRIGQHRRFAFGSTSLAEARTIKTAFDCTVNDVVLAMCAGMLRAWLQERDLLPAQPLVAMVPVSVRTEEHGSSLGNQVSGMAAVLHTDEPDPGERGSPRSTASMRDQKILQAALPGPRPAGDADPRPGRRHGAGMRLVFGTRLSERMIPFNLTISNVPGPQLPLYLDGAEQLASYPYSTITDGMALNITVTSYNGHLDWGIVVDRDIVDDAWPFYDGLVAAQAELLDYTTSGRR